MRQGSWIAIVVVGALAAPAAAQTTGTTGTPTVTTTTSSSLAASGFGSTGGFGTNATTTGSFSGGAGMTGATGGAGFSGGTGFAGGTGMAGGAGAGARTGTTATVPSTYNPFRATYVNPLAKGALSTKTFGQPLFATVTTTPAGGLGGGFARGGAGITGGTGESTGFSTVGIRRAPAYSTTLGPDLPVITTPPQALLGEIRVTLDKVTALPSKNGVQIAMEGNTVVLRGRVESQRERRLVEGIIRLTPGVREIRNELTAP